MVYYKNWYDNNVKTVQDLIIGNRFLSFEEFKNKYPRITTNFLVYHGLIHAIPSEWKRTVSLSSDYSNTMNTGQTLKKIVSAKKVCSFYVQEQRNKMTTFPTIAFNKWNNNLNTNLVNLQVKI